MVRKLMIAGVLLLSVLSTGLVSAAHNETECSTQETEHVQIFESNEQESVPNKDTSDKTDTTQKKDKCCDKNKENN